MWARAPWVKEYSNTLSALGLLRLFDLLTLPGNKLLVKWARTTLVDCELRKYEVRDEHPSRSRAMPWPPHLHSRAHASRWRCTRWTAMAIAALWRRNRRQSMRQRCSTILRGRLRR